MKETREVRSEVREKERTIGGKEKRRRLFEHIERESDWIGIEEKICFMML